MNGIFEVSFVNPMIFEVKSRADNDPKLKIFSSLPRVAAAVNIEWRGSCQSEGGTFLLLIPTSF